MAILKSTQIKGDLTVSGSLNVQGDLTYVGVENLRVKDKQIELNANDSGSAALTGANADEAGIVIRGARKSENVIDDASILYDYADDTLVVNKTIKGTVSNATTAASANKVANKLTVNVKKKVDGAENTETVVFDGSAAETVNIDLKALQDQIDGMSGDAGSIATQINNAINNLDVPDTAVDGQYVSSVSETDGKISVTRVALPDYTETYDAKGAAAQALKDAKSYADGLASNYDAKGAAAQALVDAKSYADGLNTAMDGRVQTLESASHAHDNKAELDKIVSGDVAKWNAKQNALTETQLTAVNSGITKARVDSYEAHVTNDDIHVTAGDKAKWNAAEQNAKDHADGLNNAMNTRVAKLEAIDHKKLADDASAAAVAKVVDGAPESFDTLKEVAAWIADNNHAATVAELVTDVNNLKKIDHNAYKAADEATLASAKSYADGLAKNYAAAEHSHAIADVTGLQDELNGKAASDHNHDTVYSKLGHTHAIADVTDLQAALDAKQNKLEGAQLRAVNSGITSTTVATYNAHVADTTKHITANEREAWNAAEQNAKDYADGLAGNYDASGSAAAVKSEVIGTDETSTKDSNTIIGAKKYADDKVSALSSSVATKDAAQDTEITNIKNDIANIQNGTALDDRYVNVSGDTMTGDLTMSNSGIVFGGMKIVWNVKDSAIEFVPTTA